MTEHGKYFEDVKFDRFKCDIKSDILSQIINIKDENGRTLLHWAAFLGRHTTLAFLLQNGTDISMVSENDDNFHSIHFAVVNNHTECIEILLDFGVSIEICDMYQRTPLLLASSYGRLAASVFLLSKKANLHHQDMNGNNALHFAALSGNYNLCQILLYSGIDMEAKNDNGENVLHLASKKGSKQLLKLFIGRNSALLRQVDHKGTNPISHAKFNGNLVGFEFLRAEFKKVNRMLPGIKATDFVYGPGTSKYPLVFMVFMIFFFAIPLYTVKVLFITYSDWPTLNLALITFLIGFMVNFYTVNSMEPGYLARFTREYDETLKNLSLLSSNQGHVLSVLTRLCHTCRLVRPIRSSHCVICNRCVRVIDHHCPYVYNCIGFKNRQYFLLMLLCLWVSMTLSIVLALILFLQYDFVFHIVDYVLLCFLAIFYIFVNFLTFYTLTSAMTNLTSNEARKWNKFGYEYLRDDKQNFVNPFDKGPFLNFLEFFRILVEFKTDTHVTFDV